MNKRSIIIGICAIAVTVCALGFGRTSRFGPLIAVEGRRVPDRVVLLPGKGSITRGSVSQQKEPKVDSSKQAEIHVPDYVVYGQLFRSVVLLKQMAEEEKQQGQPDSGYGRVVQIALGLNDAAAKGLDEGASAWDSEKESITSQAEGIVTQYRAARAKAVAEGKEAPAEPVADLQQLNERLNGAILDARDKLKERLGEEAFDIFDRAVQEKIAANIKGTPVDLKNPDLQKSSAPVRHFDMQTGMIPPINGEGSTGSMQSARPPINEQAKTLSIGDTQRRPASEVGQSPQPNFNFCFFGGIVFYGTYMWLAPQVNQVFQLSFTQLDFCAGLSYDPYVFGFLYSGSNYDYHESYGRSFIRPAVVLNHLFAFPSTLYSAYAEHYILQCDLGCYFFFIDAYTLQMLTPSCVAGASFVVSPNFNTCPGPSPSPTPTPTLKIDSVGFTGDYLIRKWDALPSKRKRIDFPDGTEATWRKGSNDPKLPVAYKRGTNPKMFATFLVTPAQSTGHTAQLRVKKGTTIVATKNDVIIGGGMPQVTDIEVTASALESAPLVKRGEYDFTWEISFDGGTNWSNAGSSGKHRIYWTWDAPLTHTFRDQGNVECFDTFDGTECDTLYDEALKHSAGETGSGSADLAEIIKKINTGMDNDFTYDPCAGDPPGHPLTILNRGRTGQCSALANLLRGVLRSIGIDATTRYFWGGDPAIGVTEEYTYDVHAGMSFQAQRPESNEGANGQNTCKDVETNPHFKFHATVLANGTRYDPSYGLVGANAEVNLLETSRFPAAGFFSGSDANQRKVESANTLFSEHNTGTTCNHHPAPGVLFPNPIDNSEFFVGQHYFDFLNREADPGGLAFWTGQITQCGGNQQCIDDRRVGVSQSFFQSAEFQERGYFVQRFYKASYARNPAFGSEFLPDVGTIGNESSTPELLERNKQNFADDWVETEAFRTQYPFTMEHSAYVDALFANAGVTPSVEVRTALISGLDADTENRATVLRKVVDNPAFINAEFNRAFILMCYFGYLRRDPDLGGYNFWLGILNSENDLSHMTRAFIVSTEYRARFGMP